MGRWTIDGSGDLRPLEICCGGRQADPGSSTRESTRQRGQRKELCGRIDTAHHRGLFFSLLFSTLCRVVPSSRARNINTDHITSSHSKRLLFFINFTILELHIWPPEPNQGSSLLWGNCRAEIWESEMDVHPAAPSLKFNLFLIQMEFLFICLVRQQITSICTYICSFNYCLSIKSLKILQIQLSRARARNIPCAGASGASKPISLSHPWPVHARIIMEASIWLPQKGQNEIGR